MMDLKPDSLAKQSLQQAGYIGHNIRQLQYLRTQCLLTREGKQLACQAGRAILLVLYLLNIVIIAIARLMPQQHDVAIYDNRGQNVIEIMRDTTGQAPDGFKFLGIEELLAQDGALQFGALALAEVIDGKGKAAVRGSGQ